MEPQATNPYAAPTARVEDAPDADAPPLWNPESAGAWSLLLSVIFGAWITMQNWTALGESERASTARVWLIVSVIVFVLVLFVPGLGALGFPYLIIWYFAQNRPQIKYVKETFGKDYPRRPWTKVVLLTLAGVFLVAFVLGLARAMVFRH
jgi:hypothetical protein